VTAAPLPTNTAAATRTSTPTRPPTPAHTSTPSSTPSPTRLPYGSGDASKNGRVDALDALLVLQHVDGEIQLGAREANADVNRDGDVTAVDATIILQFVARRIPALPTR
jgi:hypothetical protein